MDKPKIAAAYPVAVQVQKDKIYAWCTCGLSATQPWCDGAHKQIEDGAFKSQKVSFEQDGEVWLCQCKQSKNPPFCDGSHKVLPTE
jgi:CDGSH-type Zn-finger protein